MKTKTKTKNNIGTAGWAVPKAVADRFARDGTGLQRYAGVFNCTEINSTFSRKHRASTYERWVQSVPDNFAFSVKVPKEVTHVRKLVDCRDALARFVDETAALGKKRQVLLVQVPPKLAYDARVAGEFFAMLQSLYSGSVVLEPRHPSWFDENVEAWLQQIGVARVAADPATVPRAGMPGGSRHLTYYRLHGSPRVYYSSYSDDAIASIAERLRAVPNAWCIFDNTASGAGAADALRLLERLRGSGAR